MARAKTPAPKNPNTIYLNVDLTKEMKGSLVKWVEQNPNLLDQLEKALDSTLRFGCSFDTYNECFQASFTKLPPKGTVGTTLVLIGRGGNLLQAIQALVFKYFVVLQEDLEETGVQNPRGVSDWG